MKTIIETATNLSKYVFEDDVVVSLTATNIETPNFIVADLNSENATMVEGVTIPDDWSGNKYTYANGAFTLNPDWTNPADEEV